MDVFVQRDNTVVKKITLKQINENSNAQPMAGATGIKDLNLQ